MCITFYSLIQCKLCLDVRGIWRTEALLAGVGAIWAGESGWSCVVLQKRRVFPDAQGRYTGFRPALD